MRLNRSLIVLSALFVGVFGTNEQSQAQAPTPTVISAEVDGPSTVSAYAGWVAWSRYDSATRRWSLVARAPGAAAAVPVKTASRTMPFDVDLGPDRRGRPVAVFSRCEFEHKPNPLVPIAYRLNRGCRIMQIDLTSARETLRYQRRGSSVFLPTIWRSRLTYAIRTAGDDSTVRIEDRVSEGRRISVQTLGRGPRAETSTGPTRLERYGQWLAIGWRHEDDALCTTDGSEGDYGPFTVTSVYLQRDRAARRVIERGCAGVTPAQDDQPQLVASPTIGEGHLIWVASRLSGGTVSRQPLKGGATRGTPLLDGYGYDSLSADGTALYGTGGSGSATKIWKFAP